MVRPRALLVLTVLTALTALTAVTVLSPLSWLHRDPQSFHHSSTLPAEGLFRSLIPE